MANFGDFLRVALGGTAAALGSADEQRRQEDLLRKEAEKQREFGILRQAEADRLAELKRQHDMQYGEQSWTDPATGETIRAPRNIIGAVIQGRAARERELSPEEIGTLGTIRERIVNPQAADLANLEAQATEKAFPQFRTSPLTVDIPQDVRLPRQVIEKTMTEAGQIRKEQEAERRANLQRDADAAFRSSYDSLRAQNVPHPVAQAVSISRVQRQLGVAPSLAGFLPTPTERVPRLALGAFTDEKGNRVVYGVDPDTAEIKFRQTLGKVQTKEGAFNLGAARYNLALRSQGKLTKDSQIDSLTPQEAAKALQDLNRSDFLSQLLTGGGHVVPGTASSEGPTSAETEADNFLKTLE